MENQRQSLWQFSDQLRLANLSLNDSIWSNSFESTRSLERKGFDVRVGAGVQFPGESKPKGSSDFNGFNDGWNSFKLPTGSDLLSGDRKPVGSGSMKQPGSTDGWNSFKPKASDFNGFNDGWNSFKPGGSAPINVKPVESGNMKEMNDGWNNFKPKPSDYNGFNDGWKNSEGPNIIGISNKDMGINGGNFSNKGLYYKLGNNPANNNNSTLKGDKNGGGGGGGGAKGGKKSGNNESKAAGAAEKRFKTLPAAESLPRNEMIGGYIFVCNNETMQENLRRQIFGLPPRYRDSVRAITPGLPLFLYNYSTHQLHGIFEAASFGGSNIDPTAWEDKKCPGESRFPAQVRVITRKVCEPLEEDSFRPILHHYDGPKFRLELSIPEAISLLDILEEQNP